MSADRPAARVRVRDLREAANSEIDFGNFTDAAMLNTEADRIEADSAAPKQDDLSHYMMLAARYKQALREIDTHAKRQRIDQGCGLQEHIQEALSDV